MTVFTVNSIDDRIFISVAEAAQRIGVGRTHFYLKILPAIRSVYLGGRRLVDASSLASYAASLPDARRE